MPDDNTKKSTSEVFREARLKALELLSNQLDELLSEKLIPEKHWVPFIQSEKDNPNVVAVREMINNVYSNVVPFAHFEKDPPPVVAIKKIINSLYYIEEALKAEAKWKRLKGGPKAIYYVLQAVSLLSDATLEVNKIIAQNYYLFEPLYSNAFEIIKDSGWMNQFLVEPKTEKISKIIGHSISLLGTDTERWDITNPLISTFEKIAELMSMVVSVQNKDESLEFKEKQIGIIRAILNDLDNNVFINQLAISDFEDAKIMLDLLKWFKSIEEDRFIFTSNSIKQYIEWANHYLPKLIVLADQLERKNYLKSGILSENVCTHAETLALKINQIVDAQKQYQSAGHVLTLKQLISIREQSIDDEQIEAIQAIVSAEQQKKACALFFGILAQYTGKKCSEISESDRVLIREIYPQIQWTLAYADLSIENMVTQTLNTIGPETIVNPVKTWWQSAKDLASLVSTYEINKILALRPQMDKAIETDIDSELFKLKIAEKSRDMIRSGHKEPILEEYHASLDTKVEKRMDILRSKLKKPPTDRDIIIKSFTPIKKADLDTLEGTLTYIQQQKLSNYVEDLRKSLIILKDRHIAKEKVNLLQHPHIIMNKEDKRRAGIDEVEKNLMNLREQLVVFEKLDFKRGITIHVPEYIKVATACAFLKRSIVALDPGSKELLEPVMEKMKTLAFSISNKRGISANKAAVKGLLEQHLDSKKTPVNKTLALFEKGTIQDSSNKSVKKTLDYAKKIASIRRKILLRAQSNLSPPISNSISVFQKNGVPFQNIDQDAPQIMAIKKIVNCLYYAEAGMKTWHDLSLKAPDNTVEKAHHVFSALSQLYKFSKLCTDAVPEIQNLLRENHELIKPLINHMEDLLEETEWENPEWIKISGSILGKAINVVQPPKYAQTKSASLVQLISELPVALNTMTQWVGGDTTVSIKNLRVHQDRIDAICKIVELVFEKNSSLVNIFKAPQAILGMVELNTKFKQEGIRLKDSTIKSYQEWINIQYPKLLFMIDSIETHFYLKAGSLSDSILLEIDKLNDKLNEVIEGRPLSQRHALVTLSSDMVHKRNQKLHNRQKKLWIDSFKLEKQDESATIFFSTLNKYKNQSFLDITKEDKKLLRRNFAHIQLPMANANLDIANHCVTALNQLETVSPKKLKIEKLTITQLLDQEVPLRNYIAQRQKTVLLKQEVIEHAIKHIEFTYGTSDKPLRPEKHDINTLRAEYALVHESIPSVKAGTLKPIGSSSLYNIRGNLAYIQELEVSSTIKRVREQFTEITQDKFSRLVQNYLKKTPGQKQQIIHKGDPVIVNQIKAIENGFYSLETAFKHFESISKNDTLVKQARAFAEIQHEAIHFKNIIKNLKPELEQHYGSFISNTLEFIEKIRNIEYNRRDLEDFGIVLQDTKQKLLSRLKPRKTKIERAFFDNRQNMPVSLNESAAEKARRLGVKYVHLASPTLEDARKYLRSLYPDSFEAQPPIIRKYTRRQLGDEVIMRQEITRLTTSLRDHYGFNLTTINVIIDVVNQIRCVGIQAPELVGMVNKLVTDDYVKIKENVYKDLIILLSQEEDYLGLKPGMLIGPAMILINQLFLSVALELDIVFDKKLSILNETTFLTLIVNKTSHELEELQHQILDDPNNQDRAFKIKIKKDKLEYLKQECEIYNKANLETTKQALLDIQFEVYLKAQLKETSLRKPLIDDYKQQLRILYDARKREFLSVEDCAKELHLAMEQFKNEYASEYLIVEEAYYLFEAFGKTLPSDNQELKNYITTFTTILKNASLPINERVYEVLALPNNSEFMETLCASDVGTPFYTIIIQFIVRVLMSIIDSIVSGKNITYLYNQKKIEDLMNNIEANLKRQSELLENTNLPDGDDNGTGEQPLPGM